VVVISDTSPINYLCQIGHIDVLPAIFGRVVVPSAVAEELRQAAAPESVRQFIADPPDWLDIREPNSTISSIADFGAGERQAIALAHELHADFLIVDDLDARVVAEQRHIAVIGTLGILKLAAGRRLVQLPKAIADLQAYGFYISDNLKREMLSDRSRSTQ
jgi:predicted nucleic acid-binding protein